MKNWVKIQSFDRYHQAELRKNILNRNDINAVILDEKDSLFLLGDIDLYVEEFNEKKARVLIDEFNGLTKINSYVDLKPILLFQKVLQEAEINTILKRKESVKYILDNYELYVENKDVEKVIPFLTGEKLSAWEKVLTCNKLRQTKYYVDLLGENLINAIVIKKKDSNYHLEAVNIYVKKEDSSRAEKVISELQGYELLQKYDTSDKAEKAEELLLSKKIQGLIQKRNGEFLLYVKKEDFEEAKDYLSEEKEWVLLKTYSNIANAMFHKSVLDEAGIPSVIINDKDTTFLLGEIELYTEEDMLEAAQKIIANF